MSAESIKCPLCQFEIPASATVCGHCGAQVRWGLARLGRLLIIPAGIFGVIAVLVGIFVVFVMFYGGTGYQNPNTFGAFLGILLVVGIGTAPLFLVGMIFRSKGWYPKKIFPWERIYGRGDYDD